MSTEAVFGGQISTSDGSEYPGFVDAICEQIRDRGLRLEGIFTAYASPADIAALRAAVLDRVWADKFPSSEIPVLWGLLQQYVTELSESLLTVLLEDDLLNFDPSAEDADSSLQAMLDFIPGPNRALAGTLFRLLFEIRDYAELNGMTTAKLCKMWCPLVFRSTVVTETRDPDETLELLKRQALGQRTLRYLIENVHSLFTSDGQQSAYLERRASTVYDSSSEETTSLLHSAPGSMVAYKEAMAVLALQNSSLKNRVAKLEQELRTVGKVQESLSKSESRIASVKSLRQEREAHHQTKQLLKQALKERDDVQVKLDWQLAFKDQLNEQLKEMEDKKAETQDLRQELQSSRAKIALLRDRADAPKSSAEVEELRRQLDEAEAKATQASKLRRDRDDLKRENTELRAKYEAAMRGGGAAMRVLLGDRDDALEEDKLKHRVGLEIARLRTQMDTLLKENAQLKGQLEQQETRYEKDVDATRAELRQLAMDSKELKNRLDKSFQETTAANQQLRETRLHLDATRAMLDENKSNHAAILSSRDQRIAQMERSMQQQEQTHAQERTKLAEQAQEARDELNATVERYSLRVAELTNKMDAKQNDLATLENQVPDLQGRLQAKTEQATRLADQCEHLRRTNDSLEEAMRGEMSKANKWAARAADQDAKLSEMADVLQDAREQLVELDSYLRSARDSRDAAIAQKSRSDAMLAEAEAELFALRKMHEQHMSDAKMRVEQAQYRADEMMTQNEDLSRELELAEAKVSRLSQAHARVKELEETLQELKMSANEQMEDMEMNVSKSMREAKAYQELAKTVPELEGRLTQSRKKYADLKLEASKRLKQLMAENQELRASYAAATKRVSQLEASNADLRADDPGVLRMAGQVSQLSQELSDVTARLEDTSARNRVLESAVSEVPELVARVKLLSAQNAALRSEASKVPGMTSLIKGVTEENALLKSGMPSGQRLDTILDANIALEAEAQRVPVLERKLEKLSKANEELKLYKQQVPVATTSKAEERGSSDSPRSRSSPRSSSGSNGYLSDGPVRGMVPHEPLWESSEDFQPLSSASNPLLAMTPNAYAAARKKGSGKTPRSTPSSTRQRGSSGRRRGGGGGTGGTGGGGGSGSKPRRRVKPASRKPKSSHHSTTTVAWTDTSYRMDKEDLGRGYLSSPNDSGGSSSARKGGSKSRSLKMVKVMKKRKKKSTRRSTRSGKGSVSDSEGASIRPRARDVDPAYASSTESSVEGRSPARLSRSLLKLVAAHAELADQLSDLNSGLVHLLRGYEALEDLKEDVRAQSNAGWSSADIRHAINEIEDEGKVVRESLQSWKEKDIVAWLDACEDTVRNIHRFEVEFRSTLYRKPNLERSPEIITISNTLDDLKVSMASLQAAHKAVMVTHDEGLAPSPERPTLQSVSMEVDEALADRKRSKSCLEKLPASSSRVAAELVAEDSAEQALLDLRTELEEDQSLDPVNARVHLLQVLMEHHEKLLSVAQVSRMQWPLGWKGIRYMMCVVLQSRIRVQKLRQILF